MLFCVSGMAIHRSFLPLSFTRPSYFSPSLTAFDSLHYFPLISSVDVFSWTLNPIRKPHRDAREWLLSITGQREQTPTITAFPDRDLLVQCTTHFVLHDGSTRCNSRSSNPRVASLSNLPFYQHLIWPSMAFFSPLSRHLLSVTDPSAMLQNKPLLQSPILHIILTPQQYPQLPSCQLPSYNLASANATQCSTDRMSYRWRD